MKKLTAPKSYMPVLRHIRAINGMATITDLDITVSEPCRDAPNGLYQSMELLKAGIRSDINLDEYPTLPDENIGFKHVGKVKPESLDWLLKAASKDQTRYNICGLFFESGSIVATDDHRLHFTPADITLDKPVIVPSAAFTWLDKKGDVVIQVSPTYMKLVQGHRVIITRLVDGQFPDYRKILPKADEISSRSVTLDARQVKAVKDAIPTCKLLQKDAGKQLTIKCNTGIHCSGPDGQFDIVAGPVFPYPFGIQPKYLVDAAGGKAIDFKPNGDGSNLAPTVWDTQFGRAIIMPMRFE